MKQLKVIVSEYTSTNGIFRASFRDTFTIEPDSRITFDKISYTVEQGNTTAIILPNQVIGFNPTANYSQGTSREVLIPGGNYATFTELFKVMNIAFAATLNSEPLYAVNPDVPADMGLALYNLPAPLSPNTYQFIFDQEQNSYIDEPNSNMVETEVDGNIVFTPSGVGDFYMYDTNPILMGALSASTSIFNFDSLNAGGIDFDLGFYDTNGDFKYGIQWKGYQMNLVNDGGVTGLIPNPVLFDNTNNAGIRSYFFIKNGHLCFALCNMSDANPNEWYYLIEPIEFTGFDVNQTYFFGLKGYSAGSGGANIGFTQFLDTNDPRATVNNRGYYINPVVNAITYTTTPPLTLPIHYAYKPPDDNVFERSVRLDFNNALTLLNGLNLGPAIRQTLVSVEGSITGIGPIGFISNQELELDILDLPLESYISYSGGNSGRVNAVTFFTPVLVNPVSLGSALFIYENKNLNYIDIKNKFAQVIESLSFRLFNPVTPTATIKFKNISFNMYIQNPKDGLPIVFA